MDGLRHWQASGGFTCILSALTVVDDEAQSSKSPLPFLARLLRRTLDDDEDAWMEEEDAVVALDRLELPASRSASSESRALLLALVTKQQLISYPPPPKIQEAH